MIWIYLSPHFDDVALSCGGLVWEQAQAGEVVEICTICAGDQPPVPLSPFAQSLHTRWQAGQEAVVERRREDIAACARLQAHPRHLPVPDCIYRRDPGSGEALYPSEESLFGPLRQEEMTLVRTLADELAQDLPGDAEVVCPLALGNHVDHQLTLAVARLLDRPLWFYADYPYRLEEVENLANLQALGWQPRTFNLSKNGLSAWQQAVGEYASQISTFWEAPEAMETAIARYADLMEGVELWLPPGES